jgi:hypothetical protein
MGGGEFVPEQGSASPSRHYQRNFASLEHADPP